MNTPWQLGDPTGGPATGPPAAKGGLNCYGTNLTANYGISSLTWLRTPLGMIDLSTALAATVGFQQWVDMDAFDDLDRGTVRFLDVSGFPESGVGILGGIASDRAWAVDRAGVYFRER